MHQWPKQPTHMPMTKMHSSILQGPCECGGVLISMRTRNWRGEQIAREDCYPATVLFPRIHSPTSYRTDELQSIDSLMYMPQMLGAVPNRKSGVCSLVILPSLHLFQKDILKMSVQRTGKPFPHPLLILSDVSTLLSQFKICHTKCY